MPFGGFDSFEDCVRKSQDKESPEAFCSWLSHQTTGEWPGQMTQGLPQPARERFWQVFSEAITAKKDWAVARADAIESVSGLGWVRMKQGWMHRSDHKISTRQVFAVPVFASGEHNGDKYTLADLKDMVSAFSTLKGRVDPPLKVGHTSDEFNKALAKRMGVDTAMVGGENGNGAMGLGYIDNLRLAGNILYADLVDVPEPVAELIESKGYKKVSCEVLFNFEDQGKTYPKVISGLALLGAELPAVKEAGLETAAVFTVGNKPDKVVEFDLDMESVTYEQVSPSLDQVEQTIEQEFKGKAGVGIVRAMWKEVRAKMKSLFEKKGHYEGTSEGAIKGWETRRGGASISALSPNKTDPNTGKSVRVRSDQEVKVAEAKHERIINEADNFIATTEARIPSLPPEKKAAAEAMIETLKGARDRIAQNDNFDRWQAILPSDTGKDQVMREANKQHSEELLPAAEVEFEIKPKEEGVNKEILKLLGLAENASDGEALIAIDGLKKAANAATNPADALGPVKAALGLPPEATPEDCIAKIKEMMGGGAQMKEFADRVSKLEVAKRELEASNKTLTRQNRKAEYRQEVAALKAISGTAEELAEEMTALEETAGAETAKKVLARYKDQNARLVAAGIFANKGTPAEGDGEHPFVKEVKKYMQEKHVTEAVAQAALRKSDPDQWRSYMADSRKEKVN